MFEIEWKMKESVYRNLIQIKGVSHTLASKICAMLGISTCHRTLYSSLAPHKVDKLNIWISVFRKKNAPFKLEISHPKGAGQLPPVGSTASSMATKVGGVGGSITFNPIIENLEEFKKDNIKMLISLNALRGRRFKQGYPVRGQRTRSNARTAKRLNRAII